MLFGVSKCCFASSERESTQSAVQTRSNTACRDSGETPGGSGCEELRRVCSTARV
jgi:hypothetical protein